MNYKSLIPEGFTPTTECIDWLTTESFKLWRLAENAADAHNWKRYDTLSAMGNIIWDARNEAWDALMRDTKKRLDRLSEDWNAYLERKHKGSTAPVKEGD